MDCIADHFCEALKKVSIERVLLDNPHKLASEIISILQQDAFTLVCHNNNNSKKHAERKGRKQGRKQGLQQGIKQGTLATLTSLVVDGLLQIEEAAKRADLSVSAFRIEMKKAGLL